MRNAERKVTKPKRKLPKTKKELPTHAWELQKPFWEQKSGKNAKKSKFAGNGEQNRLLAHFGALFTVLFVSGSLFFVFRFDAFSIGTSVLVVINLTRIFR